MAYDPDFEIYKGKKIGSLFEDIVTCSENRRNQLEVLISDIRAMIKTPENAMILVPLIKDYMDIGVRNDDSLVKLAAVVQRLLNAAANGADELAGGFVISEDEKKQLLADLDEAEKSIKVPIPSKPKDI